MVNLSYNASMNVVCKLRLYGTRIVNWAVSKALYSVIASEAIQSVDYQHVSFGLTLS
jgi:hypothetical protein